MATLTGRTRTISGYLADLLLLDVDPFTIAAEDLHRVKPLATMVAGEWVYRA